MRTPLIAKLMGIKVIEISKTSFLIRLAWFWPAAWAKTVFQTVEKEMRVLPEATLQYEGRTGRVDIRLPLEDVRLPLEDVIDPIGEWGDRT